MAKYWEEEKPVVHESTKTQIRFFAQASKIQVFPVVPTAPRGVGKGVVIDLESMEGEELDQLADLFHETIEAMKERL